MRPCWGLFFSWPTDNLPDNAFKILNTLEDFFRVVVFRCKVKDDLHSREAHGGGLFIVSHDLERYIHAFGCSATHAVESALKGFDSDIGKDLFEILLFSRFCRSACPALFSPSFHLSSAHLRFIENRAKAEKNGGRSVLESPSIRRETLSAKIVQFVEIKIGGGAGRADVFTRCPDNLST